MTRESVLIILGVLLLLSPFLGIPYTWLMVLVPVLSLGVIGIGITLRRRRTPLPEAPETYGSPDA